MLSFACSNDQIFKVELIKKLLDLSKIDLVNKIDKNYTKNQLFFLFYNYEN